MSEQIDRERVEADALQFVEDNWVRLWRRINLGGLVQHQLELAAVLAEFANQSHASGLARAIELLKEMGQPILAERLKRRIEEGKDG